MLVIRPSLHGPIQSEQGHLQCLECSIRTGMPSRALMVSHACVKGLQETMSMRILQVGGQLEMSFSNRLMERLPSDFNIFLLC